MGIELIIPMTKEDWDKFQAELQQLRTEHHKDYEKWYEFANYPDIQDYCETGYLINLYLRPQA